MVYKCINKIIKIKQFKFIDIALKYFEVQYYFVFLFKQFFIEILFKSTGANKLIY